MVTLRRRHFDECSLPRLLSRETHAAMHFENDIYTKASHPLMICCVKGHIAKDRRLLIHSKAWSPVVCAAVYRQGAYRVGRDRH